MRATITGVFLGAQLVSSGDAVQGEVLMLEEPEGRIDVISFVGDPDEAAAGLLEIKPMSSLLTAEIDVTPRQDTDGSVTLACRLYGYAACALP